MTKRDRQKKKPPAQAVSGAEPDERAVLEVREILTMIAEKHVGIVSLPSPQLIALRGIPKGLVDDIQGDFKAGKYQIGEHAFDRMNERSILPSEVRNAVLQGEPIEYDPPMPGRPEGVLFNGETSGGRPIHIKVGIRMFRGTRFFVATVYEADPNIFEDGYSVRISARKEQDV